MLSEPQAPASAGAIAARLRARNPTLRAFFAREAPRIAAASQAMAERFLRGGRLYAFGRGAYATDAAHVAVEFVHPVIVGKRALPGLDVSLAPDAWIDALTGPDDIVVAFGPPAGDPASADVLASARRRGALTLGLGTPGAEIAFAPPTDDEHVHQEVFELVGHTLYESVHVFFEHRERGHDVGASSFLYPYLGREKQDTSGILTEVASSIVAKAAAGERLREQLAVRQAEAIARAAIAIARRVANGGRILTFGNGGSATDATDFALDCVRPPAGMRPIAALSLAAEAPTLTAIANDVGTELIFVRQLIAQHRADDVAFAFSTSGGSKNVVAALREARARGLATAALLGYDGGDIARHGLADHTIVVACDEIPRIQEAQAAVYHVLREALGEACDAA